MSTTMPPHHAGTQARSLTASSRCLFSMSHLLSRISNSQTAGRGSGENVYQYVTSVQPPSSGLRPRKQVATPAAPPYPYFDPPTDSDGLVEMQTNTTLVAVTATSPPSASDMSACRPPDLHRLPARGWHARRHKAQHSADPRVPLLTAISLQIERPEAGDLSTRPRCTQQKGDLAAEGGFGWLRAARSLGPSPTARSGLGQGSAREKPRGHKPASGDAKGVRRGMRDVGCGMWEFPWNPYDIDLAAHQPPGPLFPPVLQQKPCLWSA